MTKAPLLHVAVSDAMLEALDDYFHEQRYPSRSAAVKGLLAYGLLHRPSRKDAETLEEQYAARSETS